MISRLLSITLQGLLLLCNVFACHKFSILSVRQNTDPLIALLCFVLFLFCFLSIFFFFFYCGTKNVKAVKGCSVFYESLSSLVIETNVIHSKVTEGYLYERKRLVNKES